ncbi:hypothetical protein [Salarchaeum japonicum]|uniref:Uncharacterized protein n=1 Tax=Salarchaeum japonicum TaxID=555573 RepID=A0AAV3SYT3_9EURY|nr:hypothetical protein [Salarchaeum japonicum]
MPDVKRIQEGSTFWTATIRYGHDFETIEDDYIAPDHVQNIAQGARVRLGRTHDGSHLVHEVQVPRAALRSESHVRQLATTATDAVEA